MGFGYNNAKVASCYVKDPAANGTAPLFKVPASTGGSVTLNSANACFDAALAAGTANGREIRLLNGGADGSGATALTPWLGTATGGTYAAWVACTAQALTLGTATVASGSWIMLEYKETGTDAFKNAVIDFEYHDGTS